MRLALAVLALALLALPARAQLGGAPVEDHHNLGALGLGVDPDGATLVVRKVHAGGPAALAGVAEGDVITKVDGQPLAAAAPGPVLQVVAEVERAEAQRKRTPVTLTVRRGGAEQELALGVAANLVHARTCPKKCKKCEAIVAAGLAFLAAQQAPDGSFPTELGGKTGKVVVTSLGGLAFLAAGAPVDGNGPLARATTYVLQNAGKAEASPFGQMGGGNWNQENWELGYGLMFLSEMAKRTRRPELKAKCAELVARLQQNQEQSGGWAHGPGGPNALGYLELEIVGNYALLGLGAAHRLGLDIDEPKVGRALAWIESTASGDGGVGYSPREGQKGFGDPGRTAGAIVAYTALGQGKNPFVPRMGGFFERHLADLPGGHVSPCMHLLSGAMASRLLGPRMWAAYLDTYRLQIMAARCPDGSFASTPTSESESMHSNTDLTVGSCWTTATYVLILSLPEDHLPLLLGGEDAGGDDAPAHGRTRTGG
jgi:hypothetical protein